MDQVQGADKKESNSKEQEVIIFQAALRIPGKNENTESNNNAEHLCQAVEKKVALKADDV